MYLNFYICLFFVFMAVAENKEANQIGNLEKSTTNASWIMNQKSESQQLLLGV